MTMQLFRWNSPIVILLAGLVVSCTPLPMTHVQEKRIDILKTTMKSYISRDTGACEAIDYSCRSGLMPFQDTSGCGCIVPVESELYGQPSPCHGKLSQSFGLSD